MTTLLVTPARRQRRSIILTDRLCEKRVAERVKIYDRKCPGLFVSITPRGVATFSVKFTDKQTGKQRIGWLNTYNPETFTVDHARSEVWRLKGKGGDAVAATFRAQQAKAKHGKTVDEIIEERIKWMETTLVKKRDGEMKPGIETLGERRQPSAPFHRPTARQKARQRSHQERHRDAVERHRGRPTWRQAFGLQCPSYAQRGLGPVQLGGGGGPRLCDRQPLHQSAETAR